MINQSTDNVEFEVVGAPEAGTEVYEALQRLLSNEDFKKVILDGYLREEAVRYTSLLAIDGMQGARGQIFEKLSAISHLEDYLSVIDALGAPATEDDEE